MNEVCLIARIPNRKTDINNDGALSADYIGRNWVYPDGDYATRMRIWEEHVRYVKGFFYYFAHESRVLASGRVREVAASGRSWRP